MKECKTCKHLRSDSGMHLWCDRMCEAPMKSEEGAAGHERKLLNQKITCAYSAAWSDPSPDEILSNAAVVRCYLEAHYQHKLVYSGDGTVPSGEVAVALLIHVLRKLKL